jgi:peptidoglycan hydrolase-like protein with peptidoglycan-binding domain
MKNKILHAISNDSKVIIKYLSSNNEVTERLISDIEFTDEFDKFGYYGEHIRAYCHLRNDERNFKIDRILSFTIVGDLSANNPNKAADQERVMAELPTQSPISSPSITPQTQDNPIKPKPNVAATVSTPRHLSSSPEKSITPEVERKISSPEIGTNAPKSKNEDYSVFLFWGVVAIFILLLMASKNNDSNRALSTGPPSLPKNSPEQASTSTKNVSNSPSVPSVQVIKKVQQLLADIGYKPGRVDGNLTIKTRDAIIAFRQENRFTIIHDGITETLLSDLQRVKSEYSRRKEAQKLLSDLGYKPGPIDGKPSLATINSIIAFHISRNQQFRGSKIDDQLLSELRSAVSKKYYQKNKSKKAYKLKNNKSHNIIIDCGEGFISTSEGGCKPTFP